MKKIIIILIATIALTSCASKSTFHTFYDDHRGESDFSISISSFFVNKFIPRKDLGEFRPLLRKAKNYKIMVFSDREIELEREFNKFVRKRGYANIFRVTDNRDNVQLYFLKDHDMIKEILLKVKSEDDYVLIGAQTKILESELFEMIERSEIEVSGVY